MHTQISNVLNKHSNAIQMALTKYNAIASTVNPPWPQLQLKDILDYVCVGQFDLLHLSRHGILEKPWAQLAAQAATSAYFKLKRSQEEIVQVEIEAWQLSQFMSDVEGRVDKVYTALCESVPALAVQVARYGQYLSSAHKYHRIRLHEILPASDIPLQPLHACRPFADAPILFPSISDTLAGRSSHGDVGDEPTSDSSSEEGEDGQQGVDELLEINQLVLDSQ